MSLRASNPNVSTVRELLPRLVRSTAVGHGQTGPGPCWTAWGAGDVFEETLVSGRNTGVAGNVTPPHGRHLVRLESRRQQNRRPHELAVALAPRLVAITRREKDLMRLRRIERNSHTSARGHPLRRCRRPLEESVVEASHRRRILLAERDLNVSHVIGRNLRNQRGKAGEGGGEGGEGVKTSSKKRRERYAYIVMIHSTAYWMHSVTSLPHLHSTYLKFNVKFISLGELLDVVVPA